MEYITSKSNEKVKYLKSLNEKKFRQKYNEYYLEGIKVVNELLDMYNKEAVDIKSIAYSYDIVKNQKGGVELLDRIQTLNNIDLINIDENIFKTIVETVTTQGILVVVKNKEKTINDIDLSSNIVILDRLQDSGNVGTIIRTALSFNVTNILCISGTADVYSQKVLRSTMASIFKVNVINIGENDIEYSVNYIKNNNYSIIGTSLEAKEYISKDMFKTKTAIVIGNEANGISDNVIKLCDKLVKIPMSGLTESLNAACAASIMLYEQYK